MELLRQKDIEKIERETLQHAARVMCDMCGGYTVWCAEISEIDGEYIHAHKQKGQSGKVCQAVPIHRLLKEFEQ